MSEAKPLNDAELRAVLRACLATRYAERNRVVVLLAFKAGLRAGEITRLRRWHVMNRSDRALSPAARAFRDFAVEEGEQFLPRLPERDGLEPGLLGI